MARRIVYKLPASFVEKHQQLLDGWDWTAKPRMALAEELPDEADLARVILEAVPARGRMRGGRAADEMAIVMAKDSGGSGANAMRNYADGLTSEAESE